jgi:hypothetical protein
MKKLFSVVTVAAIVTSAFAFTTKGVAVFCIRNAEGKACQVITNKHIDDFGANFLEYPLGPGQWDGTQVGCTNAGIANCSVIIHLISN